MASGSLCDKLPEGSQLFQTPFLKAVVQWDNLSMGECSIAMFNCQRVICLWRESHWFNQMDVSEQKASKNLRKSMIIIKSDHQSE